MTPVLVLGFVFSKAMQNSHHGSTPSPVLSAVNGLYFRHDNRCVLLCFISLMSRKPLYLISSCLPSLVRYQFMGLLGLLTHFKNQITSVLLAFIILFILRLTVPYYISLGKYLQSLSLALYFFLTVALQKKKFQF